MYVPILLILAALSLPLSVLLCAVGLPKLGVRMLLARSPDSTKLMASEGDAAPKSRKQGRRGQGREPKGTTVGGRRRRTPSAVAAAVPAGVKRWARCLITLLDYTQHVALSAFIAVGRPHIGFVVYSEPRVFQTFLCPGTCEILRYVTSLTNP